MKISVLGRDMTLTLLRSKEKVVVVLTGGSWMARDTQVIRRAATELMESVLAPLAGAGSDVQMFLRSPAGWYDVRLEWTGLQARSALPMQLDESGARVQWLIAGMTQRKAFVEMKNWLADTLPVAA